MKTILPVLFAYVWVTGLSAQPVNDNCGGARELSLSIPAPCPSGGSVSSNFFFNNLGATPMVPYPSFSSCAVGTSTDTLASEVWFTFIAYTHEIEIEVDGGLASTNLVLFRGNNCKFLFPQNCAHSATGMVTLTADVIPGKRYYLMVSGGNVQDQAGFNLQITSINNCSECLQTGNLVAFPPPVNGMYSSGQTVTFCFTVEEWDVSSTVEWLHAVEFDFGQGWDVNSFVATPPPSCDGAGLWGWYDSWTGCNTGESFGPGFAYESFSGIGCGGMPNDGNPGNNWGDGGNGCANIFPPSPFKFCVTATVGSCSANTPNTLEVTARVLSDGDSGSWTQIGCNSRTAYTLVPAWLCCTDPHPSVTVTPASCPNTCDGSLTFSGIPASDSWNYAIFDNETQNLVLESSLTNPGVVTINGLCVGNYTVLTMNAITGCTRSVTAIISPEESPIAEAILVYSTCTAEGYLQLRAVNNTIPVTYAWTGPDGYTSSEKNPTDAYLEGQYILTVSTPSCSSSDTLHVNFSWTSLSKQVCENQNLTFFIPQSSCFSFYWTFEGGSPATSTLPNPTVSYSTAGSYPVQLMAISLQGGDTVWLSGITTVKSIPDASFTIHYTPGTGLAQFEHPANPGTTYKWSFGDGVITNNNASTVSHLYEDEGTYAVTLFTSNTCGRDTSVQLLNIYFGPLAGWQQSQNTGCAGEVIQFEATPQLSGSTYAWTFEGGQPATSSLQNPSVTYPTIGTFPVQLTVTNTAGSDVLLQSQAVTIFPIPEADFHINGIPGHYTINFINSSVEADSYLWFFGDNSTSTVEAPSHTYDTAGIYQVMLIATNGCTSDSINYNVQVPIPGSGGSPPIVVIGCEGLTTTFSTTASGAQYLWSFEGGMPATSTLENPVVTYPVAGIYDVHLSVNYPPYFPFSNFHVDAVTIYPNPQAAFTANSTPEEGLVAFENHAAFADSIHWFFGDGAESPAENPLHSYLSEGTYTVTLIAFNETCGSDTATQEITILFPPTASWEQNENEGCEGLSVQFNAAPQGSGLTYAWTFEGGEPANSDLSDPIVSYPISGTYSVQLIVTNAAGSDTIIQDDAIVVGPNPLAAFAANAILGQAAVQFNNISIAASSFHWDFGDGATSEDANPAHNYEAGGIYTVTLIATNACGSDTATQEITILLPPTASWEQNENEGCEGLSVQFNATPQGPGLTYSWTFEGGEPASSDLPDPTVLYPISGNYSVQLIVTNAAGADTATQNNVILITGAPTSAFTTSVNGFNLAIENNSNGGSSYFWNFGDENTSDLFAPGHIYEEEGVYTVILVTSNECGSDASAITITIDSNFPVAGFSYENEEGCAPLAVQFLNESVNVDSVQWNFPGGTPSASSELNPVVTYAEPGIYNATIISYNSAGSAAQTQMNIVSVMAGPEAAFDATQDEATVSFVNGSQNAATYEWHFGDGETSTASEPVHTYTASGDYTVQLIVANECGSDTLIKEINILIVSAGEVTRNVFFNLYPNPNKGRFFLAMEGPPAPIAELNIFDALGQIVFKESFGFQTGKLQKTILLEGLSAGVYWLSIKTQETNIARKVIIGY